MSDWKGIAPRTTSFNGAGWKHVALLLELPDKSRNPIYKDIIRSGINRMTTSTV